MKLRTIKEVKVLRGKRVLVRVDFNVPLAKDGSVADDWKIRATVPTIEFLIKKGARIVLASHLGRPTKPTDDLRLDAVAERLSRLLAHPVHKVSDCVGSTVTSAVKKLKPGDVLLLENLRFHPGEEKNDPAFASALAKLADMFVQDGFAVCHRPAASVVGVAALLPSYAGLLVLREVQALTKLLEKPKCPFVALIGGAKISTKIGLINKLLPRVDAILLGGALVHPLFQARGWEIGRSYTEHETRSMKHELKSLKIVLPVDVVVEDVRHKAAVRLVRDVKKSDCIRDIGPETIQRYASVLRGAQTIVWNGPMGTYEEPRFSHGTIALARFIAIRAGGRAFGIAGGGETVDALRRTSMIEYVDWVSTGGGAMLEFLEGKTLPGIKPLIIS